MLHDKISYTKLTWGFYLFSVLALLGCAAQKNPNDSGSPVVRNPANDVQRLSNQQLAKKEKKAKSQGMQNWQVPSAFDSLMNFHVTKMDTAQLRPLQSQNRDAKTGQQYRIQLGAYPDMVSAREKAASFRAVVPGSIEMVFDPPFYKLRYGHFNQKATAEEELLSLQEKGINGVVVSQ